MCWNSPIKPHTRDGPGVAPSVCSTTASRAEKHTPAGEKIDEKQWEQSKCFQILYRNSPLLRLPLVCGVMTRPKIFWGETEAGLLTQDLFLKQKWRLNWEGEELFVIYKLKKCDNGQRVGTLKSSRCFIIHKAAMKMIFLILLFLCIPGVEQCARCSTLQASKYSL